MSVREIEKNKRYQIEIPIGYKGSKKIRHYETFYGTKKDAMIEEYRIKIQLKEGAYVKKTDMTFENLSKEYLEIQKGILSQTSNYCKPFIYAGLQTFKICNFCIK